MSKKTERQYLSISSPSHVTYLRCLTQHEADKRAFPVISTFTAIIPLAAYAHRWALRLSQ
jgi:hypothetical protein